MIGHIHYQRVPFPAPTGSAFEQLDAGRQMRPAVEWIAGFLYSLKIRLVIGHAWHGSRFHWRLLLRTCRSILAGCGPWRHNQKSHCVAWTMDDRKFLSCLLHRRRSNRIPIVSWRR
jgi:hypothetical protein